MALKGSCRCGSCTVSLDYAEMPAVYACHCLDCQTATGSAFSLQAAVPLARLSVDGPTEEWGHANARGAVTRQYFCARCKTRLHSTNEQRPRAAILRAGTLDDSASITPVAHMWVKRIQPWIGLPAGAETHDEWIPQDRLVELLSGNFR